MGNCVQASVCNIHAVGPWESHFNSVSTILKYEIVLNNTSDMTDNNTSDMTEWYAWECFIN